MHMLERRMPKVRVTWPKLQKDEILVSGSCKALTQEAAKR